MTVQTFQPACNGCDAESETQACVCTRTAEHNIAPQSRDCCCGSECRCGDSCACPSACGC